MGAIRRQWRIVAGFAAVGVLALFLVIFVIGIGLTVYALVKAATDRPEAGEQTA